MLRTVHLRSSREVEKIRACGEIIAELFALLPGYLRPGLSAKDIDLTVQRHIESRGASCPCIGYGRPPYPAATCISINETIVHGIPRADRILHSGDIVTVDIVCGKDGYMADACRTYAVGEISEKAKRLLAATEEAFFAGLEQAFPGKRVGDVSAAIQACAEGAGYSVIRELTGHGIGREMHEAPDVPNYGRAGHGSKIQPGMVFCIEPMIACGSREICLDEDGWGCVMEDGELSAHYENTVYVSERGPVILTMTPEEEKEAKSRRPFLCF